MAKRRTPRAPFDYTDGAAEAEITLRRAREAFLDIEFRPGILRDVSRVDLGTEILGKPSRLPVGIAPTGFTRMMQSEGEYAGSQAAAAAGIPYTLSTMGTASIEDVAAAAPDGRNWFQLYLWTDRDRSLELIERAPRPATTPSWSRWTPPSPAPGCATSGMGWHHPPGADGQDGAGRLVPAGVVVQLPHPRAADLRVAFPLHRNRRGPDQLDV